MKTWYKAVCNHHKEMIDIFVNNVQTTYHYFYGPKGESKNTDELINSWLSKHYGCNLRLIHNDFDLDQCYNDNYKNIHHPPHKKYYV